MNPAMPFLPTRPNPVSEWNLESPMHDLRYLPFVDMPEFGPGMRCIAAVRPDLLAWKAAVEKRGGTLRINSMTRTGAEQQVLRDRYTTYLAAHAKWKAGGKVGPEPKPVAAANKPGTSGHQGGISNDVSTVNAFPNEPKDRQVDLLWETGDDFGWTPIIDKPDETKLERWHFDHFGDWAGVRKHLGASAAYLCSALDTGQAGEWQSDDRLTQALLLRAGYDIGEPDGVAGARTKRALELALGKGHLVNFGSAAARFNALRTLPAIEIWTKV